MATVRVGCTGWGYDDWVGGFYPPGPPALEYLPRYARVFDLVEVDSSYHRAPRLEQTRRWAKVMPDRFLFALKVPGEVTHERRLDDVEEPLFRFLEVLEPLRAAGKLGPIVPQWG